ncbi:retrovirus-related pol polyprotein from transposon TNT 1-94 [Tanacetum coccineum]
MSRKLGLKCSTSNCGPKPTGIKKNDRILQTPSRNMKNKVEAQPRKVNKKNGVVEPIHDVDVKHSLLNTNSICATCKKSMFDGVHDMCLLDFIENVNGHAKSAKKHKKQNIWKPMGHVFTEVLQIVLWYLDSGCSKHMTGNRSQLMNFFSEFMVYYVEGLGHNLFSVGQFCDGDLEVAFWKNTCFISNLEGVDLLSKSRDTNLYTISLDDMLKTSPICLLSIASKTKSWLWHRRLSHINFGKNKKSSHQPKVEDANQEKLYLLHMDLCGPMRVASINGKRYILVIVDDYSRFTWVRFLKSKDKAPELIAMASEQFSSGPGLHSLTPATSSLGLVTNPVSQQPFQEAFVPRAVVLADSHVLTFVDQDASSSSTPSIQEQAQSLSIS